MSERPTLRNVGTIKSRRNAKYAADVHQQHDYETLILLFAFLYRRENDPERKRRLRILIFLFAGAVEDITRDVRCINDPIERRYLRFHSPCLESCFTINFRFRREHMIRLMLCLRIPQYFELDNGGIVNGQEGLLIFLKLFVWPSRLTDNEVFLGWELSRLSRVFNWIIAHIYEHHRHRVESFLHWHIPYLESSKEAFRTKKLDLSGDGRLSPRTQDVCAVYDCIRYQVSRPGGDSVVDQNNNVIYLNTQMSVYSGHTKTHNFNFLYAVTAYGLILYSSGPHMGRGTDRTAFRDSGFRAYYENTLRQAQLDPADFQLLGDKIFVNIPPAFLAMAANPAQGDPAYFQDIDSVCRTAVEWVNGKVTENFKYLTYPYKLKLKVHAVGKDMVVGSILTNALTLFQGGQTANFFQDAENNPLNLEMPTPENYFFP